MISVIITTYNSKKYIARCIESILKTKDIDLEVIVVDDHSTDGSDKILRGFTNMKHITLITHDQNKGAAVSRNDGARIARGTYLVFIDVDCIVRSDTLSQLVRPLKSALCGMTQAVLCNPDGSIETAGHFLSYGGFPYNITTKPSHNKQILGTRTLVALKRSIFRSIGGYDENFIIYGEDTDLSWRIWIAGYHVLVVADSVATHYQKSSLSNKTEMRLYFEGSKNLMATLVKNLDKNYICFVLILHIKIWIWISVILLFKGKMKASLAVILGLLWNVIHIKDIYRKRCQVNVFRHPVSKEILFGSLSIGSYIRKSLTWLSAY